MTDCMFERLAAITAADRAAHESEREVAAIAAKVAAAREPNPYRGREYDADREFYQFAPHMAPHLFW